MDAGNESDDFEEDNPPTFTNVSAQITHKVYQVKVSKPVLHTKKVEKHRNKAEKVQTTPPPGPTTPTRKEPSPPKPTLKPNIQPEPLSPATNPEPIENPLGKIESSDTKIRISRCSKNYYTIEIPEDRIKDEKVTITIEITGTNKTSPEQKTETETTKTPQQ